MARTVRSRLTGIDIALDRDLVAQMKTQLVGERLADQRAGAVPQKRGFLILRNLHLAANRQNLVRLDGEAGKHILRIAFVLVNAAKPAATFRLPAHPEFCECSRDRIAAAAKVSDTLCRTTRRSAWLGEASLR